MGPTVPVLEPRPTQTLAIAVPDFFPWAIMAAQLRRTAKSFAAQLLGQKFTLICVYRSSFSLLIRIKSDV